jgi:hypothetical protein
MGGLDGVSLFGVTSLTSVNQFVALKTQVGSRGTSHDPRSRLMFYANGAFCLWWSQVTNKTWGRAIAHAVSCRLPTAAARIRDQVRTWGICGGQSGTGAGLLRVLRFPLPIIIPPTAPHSSSSIIQGWYSRPISGRRTKWTQSHPTPKIKLNLKTNKTSIPASRVRFTPKDKFQNTRDFY